MRIETTEKEFTYQKNAEVQRDQTPEKKERKKKGMLRVANYFFVFRIGGGADVLDMSRTGSHFSDDFMSTDF